MIHLEGPNGSKYLLEWSSKKQTFTAGSSTGSEACAMANGAKALLRIASVLEATGIPDVLNTNALTRTDNEGLIADVKKGYSAELAYMQKTCCISFLQLHQWIRLLEYVHTKENPADIFTKPLDRTTMDWLFSEFFRLEGIRCPTIRHVPRDNSGKIVNNRKGNNRPKRKMANVPKPIMPDERTPQD